MARPSHLFDPGRKPTHETSGRLGETPVIIDFRKPWRRWKKSPSRIGPILLQTLAALVWVAALGLADDENEHGQRLLGALYPRISSDGNSIVFAYQGAIWRVGRAGGVMTRLSQSSGYDIWPNWSPDGEQIAYVNARAAGSGPLRLMTARDGHEIELPQRPLAKDKLEFSSDGRRLLGLFQRPGNFSLCWFDIESGALGEELYADERGLRFGLSPDGNSIALATSQDVPGEQGGNHGPNCDLWIMPATGGEARKLFQFPGRVYEIAWHSDGDSLLVVSNVGGAHNDLWQIPLEQPQRGTRKWTWGQADEDQPSISSDGRWLLFTDNHSGPTSLVVRDLQNSRESWIEIRQREFQRPTGMLRLEVKDHSSNNRITARVSLRDELGKYYAPASALYRMVSQELHFYCEGIADIELPAGNYQLRIARGPEYRVFTQSLSIRADEQLAQNVELVRWTHQRDKNWYSGESHIHANYGYGEWYNSPRTMLAQSSGEDLIVSNFMVANSEADGVFDREYFRGSPDPLSNEQTILYWNEEFRSTIWGHMTLLNLKQLVEPIFTGFANTTHPHDHPTNADIADHVHDQHGHVNYTHPAQNVQDPYLSAYSAKALPLDVALGKVDSIDVMGANQEANMAVWYKLLNCGFRIPASAGTDCFLNRVRSRLPGQVRVYVHVDGQFTYERWIDALRSGKTFVTDGPMFEFSVNGTMAGGVIQLDQPGDLRVTGKVSSQYPLDRVEIISSGKVVQTLRPEGSQLSINVEESVAVSRSGWIALRASGVPPAGQSGGSLFGHTSAIYVDVRGLPIDAGADAEYFVGWIDRLRADIRGRNRVPGRHQAHVESQMAEAMDVFRGLVN